MSQRDLEADLRAEAIDALLRLRMANGRRVLRMLLRALVLANGNTRPEKPETRVRNIEELIFDNAPLDRDELKHEEIVIFMYQRYLQEKVRTEQSADAERQVVVNAASAAVDLFHLELVESETQIKEDRKKRRSLIRRYQEAFYAQHSALPERYLALIDDLSRDRDLAEHLATLLERAGLSLEKTAIRDQATCSDYEFIVAVEDDYETRSKLPKN